jgi:hypothetical protein
MASGTLLSNGTDKRFFWNVDGNVGPGCPNQPEDVHLVQLGFYCKARNVKHPPTAEAKAIYMAVSPGQHYTGGYNDPLSIAIRQFQKERGGTQDGHVSVMKGATYSGDHSYMLVALNNHIAMGVGTAWPYIDKHPKCSDPLKGAVTRCFTMAT